VSASRVAEVMQAVCGDKLGAEGANLVNLLTENKTPVATAGNPRAVRGR